MPRVLFLCLAIGISVLLAGCIQLPPRSGVVAPTIGPVQRGSGGVGVHQVTLSNTNCADVGEMVTLTGQITNTKTIPITVTGTPAFDIVITPNNPDGSFGLGAPIQRWTESADYPGDPNPVLMAGEARTYVWRWQADAAYADTGAWVRFVTGDIVWEGAGTPAGGPKIMVGVGSVTVDVDASIPCTDLAR